MQPKPATPIIKGLIIALVLFIISFVFRMMKVENEPWAKWVSGLLLCVAIIGSCIAYSNQLENRVSFGNIFADGFKTSAVYVCFTIIFIVIYGLVTPDLKQQAMDQARAQMVKDNKMTPDQIDKAVEMVSKFFWVIAIGATMVFGLILGSIASLIGAAIAKKAPPSPFDSPAV